MNELLEELNRRGGWDWCIRAFDGDALDLSAGSSLAYAHHMVTFHGLCYVECPTVFHHPVFRVASAAERLAVGARVGVDDEDTVIAIDADSSAGMHPLTFFIVATSMTLACPPGGT
ncbi:hypothetical protein [Massilia sp. CCM 8734]|uniref:hypothetical protein n=1 Tax=Massilia sp. CCM 8734 TaxID=2609283 RepID=UPI00141F97BE|nr:hypothetical protein [Massilia sp. CCM 8734]NHZ97552.1 hypothetical protein [Massilia sp. CCM 8734]